MSHYGSLALLQEEKVTLSLDFLPELSEEQVRENLLSRFKKKTTANLQELLNGLLNDKLMSAILKSCHLSLEMIPRSNQYTRVIKLLVKQMKSFTLTVSGTKGFDFAQVTGGGIDTREVDSKSMESKLVSGLFFAGEMLDVDGICGGYNLQWAWSSGYVAGYYATK